MNKDQLKWDLSSKLASYANTHFEKYILEKGLYKAICDVHPAPNKLNQVKKNERISKRSTEGDK